MKKLQDVDVHEGTALHYFRDDRTKIEIFTNFQTFNFSLSLTWDETSKIHNSIKTQPIPLKLAGRTTDHYSDKSPKNRPDPSRI